MNKIKKIAYITVLSLTVGLVAKADTLCCGSCIQCPQDGTILCAGVCCSGDNPCCVTGSGYGPGYCYAYAECSTSCE